MGMKVKKEKKAPGTAVKWNIGTIIAAVIAVIALAGIVFMLLIGNGVGKEESRVSKKEIQNARALANAEDSGEGVDVIGLDKDIVITSTGATTKEASKEEKSEDAGNTEYILPNSDTEYLTDADVSGLSKSDLRIARNEIMARHGRTFDSADLQEHFESTSWYNGTISPDEFDASMESRLSEVEKANIEMIKKYE